VLDHHDGVARVAQLVQHLQQQRRCRGSAGRWWARPGCTACGRCRACSAPAPASRAAPRRRRAWWRSAPGGCSPGPRPAASRSLRAMVGTALKKACASSTVRSSTCGDVAALVEDLQRLAVVALRRGRRRRARRRRAGSASPP
jgi:hypothetical protein